MLALAAVAGLMLTSCKDQPDKYEVAGGRPTIHYIRCLSTEIVGNNDEPDTHYTNGELVTSASPQSLLCFVGDNLRSVYELYFNDQKAILNTSLITDNTLIVSVPRTIPEEVSDKIYMITSGKDTIEYAFSVVIPAPSINTMSCEYAQAGTKASLYGNYFINDPNVPLTVIFPDGQEITDLEINSTYSTITFTVPDCSVSGPITVTSIYGSTTSAFYYKDTRGLLFDFDGVTGLGQHGWHNNLPVQSEGGINGNYLQLGNGEASLAADGSTWDDSHFSFEYWPGNWQDPEDYKGDGKLLTTLADFSNWENMAYKFEMCVLKDYPWSSCAMQIISGGVDIVSMGNAGTKDIYGNTTAGCNNTYISSDELPRALYRPWTATGSFDTGDEWITVTIPIASSFIYGFKGAPASQSMLGPDFFTSLCIFVSSGGVSGTDCTPIIRIDNIRAVPYQ